MKKLFILFISMAILAGFFTQVSNAQVMQTNVKEQKKNTPVPFLQNTTTGNILPTKMSPNTVSSYAFTSSIGTYTALSTETILVSGTFDDNNFGPITIPSFTMDGTAYTTMYVQANGWISLGTTAISSSYVPLSQTTAYSEVISAFGNDIRNASSGTPKISYNTNDGGDIVVQYQDVQRYGTTYNGNLLSFQIRLTPATGDIKIVYGGTIASIATATTYQIGLRGATNADFNNRTTTTNWSATTAGVLNTDVVTFSSTVLPTGR